MNQDLASFWQQCSLLLARYNRTEFIDHLLAMLGRMHRADRAWLIVYSADGTHFWNAHEWVRSGVQAYLDALQGTPVSLIDWLHQQLLKHQIVYIANPELLPRQARGLKAEFLRQGNKSILCVPIFHGERLLGLFGYDTVRQHESWTEAEQDLLREVGTLLGELAQQGQHPQTALQANQHHGDFIYVRMKYGLAAVSMDDVLMLEAQRDYCHIHYRDGSSSMELRSLKSWAQQLPPERFVQIARGLIVNTGRIQRLDRSAAQGWLLTLDGVAQPLKIGRQYRHQLRHLLGF